MRRVLQLGKQARELPSPSAAQASEKVDVADHTAGAERLDPRAEGQALRHVVAAAEEHTGAPPRRVLRQLLEQPRLADAGLAGDDDDAPVPLPRLPKVLQEDVEDIRASDEWQSSRRPWPEWRAPGGCARGHLAHLRRPRGIARRLLDQPPEELSLRLGRHPELAPQGLDARPVLPERGAAPALAVVQLYQRAVNGLLERIEREPAQGSIDRARHVSGLDLVIEEAAESRDRSLPQAIAFGPEPGLESRLVEDETLQEVARVQVRRLPKGFRRPDGERALEVLDVEVDAARVECDGAIVCDNAGLERVARGAAQDRQRLSKTLSRLLVCTVAPEQRRELVAGAASPGDREVREERLSLACADCDASP